MSTKKRHEVLTALKTYKEIEGEYPTLQQLAKLVGLKSASTVHQHIISLINEGYLVKNDTSTGYEISNLGNLQRQKVPLLGHIAAGLPIETIEDTAPSYIKLNRTSKNPSELYALKVKGDSMIEEGIYDGDIVVIKGQEFAYDGQTVVAVIDKNYATLKKIYKEKNNYP